jgi:hypothetical protein
VPGPNDVTPPRPVGDLPREPELAGVLDEFLAFAGDAHDLLLHVDDNQLNWRSEHGHWSIGQCMEHLVLTFREYETPLTETIADGRARGIEATGPFAHGRVMEWVIKNMEPPPRQRMKAPARFRVAEEELAVETVRRHILDAQDAYCRLVRDADGLDLGTLKLSSPVTRLVRLTLGQTFRFLAAHQRRHLWQARQVVANPRFPA